VLGNSEKVAKKGAVIEANAKVIWLKCGIAIHPTSRMYSPGGNSNL